MPNLSTHNINPITIIAIDGTTASGKGSIARRLAQHYNYNYLNSGALYRLTAFILKGKGFDFEKYNSMRKEIESGKRDKTDTEYLNLENLVVETGQNLSPVFDGKRVLVGGADVWPIISTQEYGNYAARISPTLPLREALHIFQRAQIREPGLVAEGRDMTGNVYTDALIKIFLDASPEERARRRLLDEQSEQSGKSKTYEDILEEIRDRDAKDKSRHHGPLTLTPDSYYLDTTEIGIEEVLALAIAHCDKKMV